MPTTRATKEIAQALGVSVSTMRNWSDQYAAFLSETARPGHLPERRFTDRDLTVLNYIKQLRSEGMQAEQIKERLGETTFNDIEIVAQQATTDANNGETINTTALQTAPAPLDSATAVIMALQSMQSDIEALKASVKENKQAEHKLLRDAVFLVMAGAVGALLIVLIIIVVVDLWAK